MRRELVLLLGAGLLVAGLLVWLLDWDPDNTGIPDSDIESKSDRDAVGQGQDPPAFERENSDPTSVPDTKTNWRDGEDTSAEFQRRFHQCYQTEGGEEQMIKYVEERTTTGRHEASGKILQEILDRLESSDLPVHTVNRQLYGELVWGAWFTAGNFLSSQLNQYQEWLQRRSLEGYHFPEEIVLMRPLAFSPEMIAAYWTQIPEGVEITPGLPRRWHTLAIRLYCNTAMCLRSYSTCSIVWSALSRR